MIQKWIILNVLTWGYLLWVKMYPWNVPWVVSFPYQYTYDLCEVRVHCPAIGPEDYCMGRFYVKYFWTYVNCPASDLMDSWHKNVLWVTPFVSYIFCIIMLRAGCLHVCTCSFQFVEVLLKCCFPVVCTDLPPVCCLRFSCKVVPSQGFLRYLFPPGR